MKRETAEMPPNFFSRKTGRLPAALSLEAALLQRRGIADGRVRVGPASGKDLIVL